MIISKILRQLAMLLAVLFICSIIGCGQTGKLYLPDKNTQATSQS